MGSRSISVSGEQFHELAQLAKAIRANSHGVGRLTSPDSLAGAFIAKGLEETRREWYERQANDSLCSFISPGPRQQNDA